jgi:hypothetical protein
LKNTAFNYIYRDASNYKNSGGVIFAGAMTPEQLVRLERSLDEGRYFIASQLSVPAVFLWSASAHYDLDSAAAVAAMPGEYMIGEDDHCWHEFTTATEVDQEPTDNRTIEQFIAGVEAAAGGGWLVFEPGEVAA